MAMKLDPAAARDYVVETLHGATPLEWGLQVAVVLCAYALGWTFAHLACSRVKLSPRWKFGEGDFERVAFPMATFVFLWVGKFFLARAQSVPVLDIVESLLVAWMAVRLAVYVLTHILPRGAFLDAVLRTIAWLAWIAVALHVVGLLGDVIDALDAVGFTVGASKQRVTPLLVLQALAALFLTLTVAMWLSRISETRLMASSQVEMSTRIVLSKLVRLSALFIAVMIALPMVGIDITTLSIFSGALGVGLGFGLQKIASNYVSGFIVLLDRSLRIGDIVTVDGRRGEVVAIESRYTVIKGLDGVESIIPNEKLITDSVNHHTYSDPKVSVQVAVSVSYESDISKALALLLECARRQPRIIDSPAPAAVVKQLSDSGVDLILITWIADPNRGEGELRSALLIDIVSTFKANGIEIPYPRRDVRLITTPATPENPMESRT
ncbi:MAG TPA: mechanosensitive ion channel domain-containing protein [Usitatibacter sp.]|jgi:small-conductance mechanosensitive channel|nr:mechanosensitive ion channel domain-containing protein [Usitatibacter sp.]